MKLNSTGRSLLPYLGASMLLVLLACSFVFGQGAREVREPKLSGTWVFSEGTTMLTLQLNEDGSAALQGKVFSYTARGNRLVMVDDKGEVSSYNYELKDDVLTVSGAGLPRPVNFKRLEPRGGGAKSKDHLGSALGEPGTSSRDKSSRKSPADEEDTGLAGRWQSSEIALEIFNDGRLTINGEQFNYRVDGRHVILSNNEGSIRVEFQLDRDTLATNYQGERTVYRRVRGGSSSAASSSSAGGAGESDGANPAELAGKWCYMSNVTATGGGRMSNTCFTLYPNGTYEYYSETSSSNPYGGTASQSSDAGTWSVSGSTLIANSRSNGRQVYTLEKRNHPKTGDPMLIVDGDAFVTYTQRSPW